MATEKNRALDEKALGRAVARIGYEIIERNHGVQEVVLIGIRTRGVFLAQRIAAKVSQVEGIPVPVGELDITPFRDDRERDGETADLSQIPFPITGKRVVLVDDVIHTGRTVRAAIDALMARGRPQQIQLAALIDRGHRELPIRPDFVGKNLPTSNDETIQVHLRECDGEDYAAICAND
ncbi:MAG: bifunctional pyr operon transcriptional regulator/uracil phosphoribosyltransferase PyrR [Provencibacterium sp.]|nr:bifunctional pyr operon transcriptional regulator/uracil phosphoribosyltransferase PyrR [Provencibacterium sp.]